MQQALPEFRRDADIILRLDHSGAQLPGVVLHGVSIENIGTDIVGIMRLDAFGIEFRVRITDDIACQQHTDGLAANAAGTDLPTLDVHQIPHGEVLPAQIQALRFGSQQAAEDVLFQGDAVCVRRLRMVGPYRVEHAVPAVAPLTGLRENVKDGVGIAAGGDRFAVRSGDPKRKEHVFSGPAVHLYRMNVGEAVQGANIQKHRGRVANAGDGLIDMLLIAQRHVAQRSPGSNEFAGQAKEITDHQIGKPIPLQIRQAVKQEEAVLRFR